MKTKTFDCVRMKRKGAERVMKQLEGKSLQEQLAYWQKGTEDLRRLREKLRKRVAVPRAAERKYYAKHKQTD